MRRLRVPLCLFGVLFASCSSRTAAPKPPAPAIAAAVRPTRNRDLGQVVSKTPVHVLVIGDFGTGGPSELAVAKAVAEFNRAHPFDMALTLGDNFYESGVGSTEDPQWKTAFQQPFGSLGLKFFATLGNHDYLGNADAEVDYTQPDGAWQMPARYYTYRAGPVRFYALDTALDGKGTRAPPTGSAAEAWEKETSWLTAELQHPPDSAWRIAYGHRPIYSTGFHGDTPFLRRTLLPILKQGGVQVYLAGHDHTLESVVDTQSNIAFFICGGGGAATGGYRITRSKTAAAPGSEFFTRAHGFMELIADDKQLQADFVSRTGAVLKTFTISSDKRNRMLP